MPDDNNAKPSLDERLEAIVQTAELLLKQGEDTDRRINELTEESKRNDREIQRFRRAMRAALEAWLAEPGEA